MASLGALRRFDQKTQTWITVAHATTNVPDEAALPSVMVDAEVGQSVWCEAEKTLWVFDGTAHVEVSTDLSGALLADGSVPLTGDLDLNSHRVVNIIAPADPGDAVNLQAMQDSIAVLQSQLDALITGLAHAAAVQDIVADAPSPSNPDEFYIVAATGTTPGDPFEGHSNEVAWWDGSSWDFVMPDSGEARLVESAASIYSYNGIDWVKVASTSVGGGAAAQTMVGEVKQSTLSEAQFKTQMGLAESSKWCLADGRDVTGSGYAVVTGRTHVPDLRGAFIQGAGANNSHVNGNVAWNGGTLLRAAQYETGKPTSTPFRADSGGSHTHTMADSGAHQHAIWTERMNYDWSGAAGKYPQGSHPTNRNDGGWSPGDTAKSSGGHSHTVNGAPNHTHTISGGDTVTKPNSVSLHFYIKIND